MSVYDPRIISICIILFVIMIYLTQVVITKKWHREKCDSLHIMMVDMIVDLEFTKMLLKAFLCYRVLQHEYG